jgi:hypothetical protein
MKASGSSSERRLFVVWVGLVVLVVASLGGFSWYLHIESGRVYPYVPIVMDERQNLRDAPEHLTREHAVRFLALWYDRESVTVGTDGRIYVSSGLHHDRDFLWNLTTKADARPADDDWLIRRRGMAERMLDGVHGRSDPH